MTLEEKWRRLEQRAHRFLSHPAEAPGSVVLENASTIVVIWRFPAFEPYQSWSLIQTRVAGTIGWSIRRVTWERSSDYERAANPIKQAALMIDSNPKPTLEVVDAPVDESCANRLRSVLRNLALPSLLESEGLGIDGTVSGIETAHGQARIEWWCDGPPSWRPLTQAVERLRGELDDALAHPPL